MIELYNEDCFETMDNLAIDCVNVILTSPFYNTNKKAGKNKTLTNTSVKSGQYDYVRYDVHVDSMTDDEYSEYTINLFNEFNRILNLDGCVLYNISYGAENTECMFKAVYAIITQTDFTIADVIVWKKTTALPNSCSSNRLTRLTEFVFVFCRKNEMKTFVEELGDDYIKSLPLNEKTKPLSNDVYQLILNNNWRPCMTVTGCEGINPENDNDQIIIIDDLTKVRSLSSKRANKTDLVLYYIKSLIIILFYSINSLVPPSGCRRTQTHRPPSRFPQYLP